MTSSKVELAPLRIAAWVAGSLVAVYVSYGAVLVAGGVLDGVPREPWLGVAEALCILCGPLHIVLSVCIHSLSPAERKVWSATSLVFMAAMAVVTMAVHVVQLSVGRQVDSQELGHLIGWRWPSLLYGLELVAWHLFFGLAALFSAFTLGNSRHSRLASRGLAVMGALCLLGLVGPIIGDLRWRMFGVFAYTVLFPAVCLILARDYAARARACRDTKG